MKNPHKRKENRYYYFKNYNCEKEEFNMMITKEQ